MSALAALLLFALTRAELVERFRSPVVTKLEGLVQVYADCSAEMRREYQLPVAGAAADVCRALYVARNERPRRFEQPGIVIHIGDSRETPTNVLSSVRIRPDGSPFVRIRLPAPGSSDMAAFRLAVTRAFFRTVLNREVDEREAVRALMRSDPDLRLASDYAALSDWRDKGILSEGRTDEDYLKLLRKVHRPGVLSTEEQRIFASRLFLYPLYLDLPFCGNCTELTFREAIACARTDPGVRLAALEKMRRLSVYGAGHGAKMTEATKTYVAFLLDLARGEKSDVELHFMLDEAESQLKGAHE